MPNGNASTSVIPHEGSSLSPQGSRRKLDVVDFAARPHPEGNRLVERHTVDRAVPRVESMR